MHPSSEPARVVRAHLDAQSGVISRAQARAAGLAAHDIRRLLRRREWVRVHRGVYVEHTGPLTWLQRAWAAVLWAWPAALCGVSAIHFGDDTERVIHVGVDRHRTGLVAPPGVRVHHLTDLATKAHWHTSPPRVRYEEAVLDEAAGAGSDLDAVAILAGAVQTRRTSAARLLAALEDRRRLPRRAWIAAVLADIAGGACSALEHSYLTGVERPHGLPCGRRQRPDRGRLGVIYRDVEYHRVIVELDGRFFHDSATARDRDFDRDLDGAADGRVTIRLTWGQVFGRPCRTAARLVAVMRRAGIPVDARPCGPGCPLG
ncbi:type IV toxin-antitoxin system AbiEi family antitoxin domain-containing protein [Nocardioides terrisoli]|uniref:type IV toxin-antitoxin system AbiEi family antitoxin domain-containing protein n=1 Tax=Nocardioides terrisoli TaxID=3388267 RepID=UPI00287BC36A|nr:type IV toxin-antitoxin system AbiEi family antitoxin domain-containing protein [Nocardioides marmorisolisilvae]